MAGGPSGTEALVARAAEGDGAAWGVLLASFQERLAQIVAFRMDPRLRRRIDAADVVQEAFIAAAERRAAFFQQTAQPLFLWLRWIVGNTLLDLHRHHFGAKRRDVRREVSSDRRSNEADDDNTRDALVTQLTCGFTGPATAAGRAELKARLDEALGQMEPMDREVLDLRHYEQLTSAEAAQVLGIQERAAAKRYLRALERLREVLADMPGGLTGPSP